MARSRFAMGAALLGAFFIGCFDHTFVLDSFVDAHDADPGDGICASAAGECTLRAAVEEAEALEGYDLIHVPAGTYFLTLGELRADEGLLIAGAGWEDTIIDAGGNSRILSTIAVDYENPALIALAGLTLQNGSSSNGGAIFNIENNVSLGSVSILDNVAARPNVAQGLGGGIYHQGGELQIKDSRILNNHAGASGGGIMSDVRSTLVVENSTIMGNSSFIAGGGIMNQGGSVRLKLVKLYVNSAPFGGAMAASAEEPAEDVIIEKGRFRGNSSSSASGALDSHVPVYASNTRFSRNTGPDCASPVIDLGGNDDSDGTCL